MALKTTQKADSLPSDLREHWEEAMANKFPMTAQEAAAYILSHYIKCSVNVMGDTVAVSYMTETRLPQGVQPPPAYTSYVENYNDFTRSYYIQNYIQITDFRPSNIKEKLKDVPT